MMRWDWTWEERSHTKRAPTVDSDPATGEHEPGLPEGGSQDAGGRPGQNRDEQVFRRRRLGAGVGLIAILLLTVVAIASKGNSKHPPATTGKHHVATLSPGAAERAAATANAEQNAINAVLAYTPVVRSGGSKGNDVALTFDDGPGPYTQQLVAELNRLHVHATFFAIGNQEQYFSAGTLAEVNSGDVVGDHTETHPMLATLSPHEQYGQLFEQMAQVEVVGAKRPRLFRPPYGSFNATTFKELHHLRLLMVLWSVDTADYTLPGVPAIVHTALEGAKPGAIILMHDGGGNRSETIAALPAIVKGLHKLGLHPVTIPRLMMDDPPPQSLPLPTNLSGD